jgi:hypothetical protein
MRYKLLVVLGYFFLMTSFIYGELNTGRDDIWLMPFILLAQLALGFALDRWSSALLPLALVAIAIPAGYPEITPNNAESFPIWFGVAFGVAFVVPLVLVGVIARRVRDYWLTSREGRGSRSAPGSAPPAV